MGKSTRKNHKKIRLQELDTFLDGDDESPTIQKNTKNKEKKQKNTEKKAKIQKSPEKRDFYTMSKDEQSDWRKNFVKNLKFNKAKN